MAFHSKEIKGLSDIEVLQSRNEFGSNIIQEDETSSFWNIFLDLLKEPMVLLLLLSSLIYLITGNYGDALFLAFAIILVAAISIYQNNRSDQALQKLKEYSQPLSKVIRNGETQEVKSQELVVGDYLIIEEGNIIQADGQIIQSNDFSVNESILTGEPYAVFKSVNESDNLVFQGTLVNSGLAIVRIHSIAEKTRLGKIGQSLSSIKKEKTPLEIQINDFVKKMVIAGTLVFVLVWAINYLNSHDFLDSLLKALTLAMSILPEEIPVAFSTFMAMGAWRLMKKGVIVKQMQTVESLGSATVICTDKTGTITQNKMKIEKLYTPFDSDISNNINSQYKLDLITYAMWSSEPIPFDPMEIAIHNLYKKSIDYDERVNYQMYHEYPLEGKPPMMTHIFQNEKHDRIVAAKGAPEAIMSVCHLNEQESLKYNKVLKELSSSGYRLLGVATGAFTGDNFPNNQQELPFTFLGFVAFFDPPKENIKQVINDFTNAGIKVKIITGDNSWTTKSIADQIDFPDRDRIITGEELLILSEQEQFEAISSTNIFTRMSPEAKLKIINTLKAQNEIVAMTGDGVNDGPALKSAHIGIAMGKRGTGIAKEAASIILLEDDLSNMVDAVAMGRKIYYNLKKAIRYIISIHIPIIMIVFFPLALGWVYPNIFTPVHIILLELIMGPTCSIIYESEPMEKNTMTKNPRLFTSNFFTAKELLHSSIQGVVIGIACLLLYQYAASSSVNINITRTMVFTGLMSANIFLTLINRSFQYSFITTLKYKNPLINIIIATSILLTILMIYFQPLSSFLKFESLGIFNFSISVLVGLVSVIWYEIVKWIVRRKGQLINAVHSSI